MAAMDTLFNEADADRVVEANIAKFKNNKGSNMELYKDENGVVRQIIQSEEVSRDDLVSNVQGYQALLDQAKSDLASFDSIAGAPAAAPTTEEVPLVAEPVVPEAPVAPVVENNLVPESVPTEPVTEVTTDDEPAPVAPEPAPVAGDDAITIQ